MAQKARMQKSQVKMILTACLYAKGIIHHEFEPEKQNVNGKFYKEVIKIGQVFRQVGPCIFCTVMH
jgi:hypothetical protein